MKRINKDYYYLIIPIIALAVFFAGWIFNGGKNSNNLHLLGDKSNIKEIKVVLDKNYPPYSFQDEKGEPQGILVDEWRLWEKKTGIRVELNQLLWADALVRMESGNFDVIDTIFKNTEREKIYDFTDSYADIEVPIFFHRNISGITGVESIKGFTVAVKNGDNAIEVLSKNGIVNIQKYDSEEEIIKAAKKGDVVIFVMDKPPASYYLYKLGIQKEFNHTTPLYTGSFHRAVSKGNHELLKTVENGFSEISAEEYRVINEKWFGKTEVVSGNIIRYIIIVMVIIAIILNVMFYWNISLKNRVERKTKELTAALRALERSNQKVNGIINSIPDLVFLIDSNGVYLDYLSKIDDKELYMKPEFFIGKTLSDTLPNDLAEKSMEKVKALLETKQIQVLNYELMIQDNLGFFESRYVLIDEDLILCIIRDISDKKRNEDLLYSLSIHDMPTGLFNRNYFEEQILNLSVEDSNDIGIVICDIDGLKLVNDTLGHAEGDNYLRTVAKILEENFPENSIVSRIGGDEFAVICKGLSQSEIQRIKGVITGIIETHNEKGRVVPISLSIGYAIKSQKHKSISEVFKEADDFMYREKLHHRQSIRSNNIDLLSNMLMSKSYDSDVDKDRMIDCTLKLAMKQGIINEKLKDMRLFAQFHDVGKIGISERLLFKDGPLSEEEWIEMKRHTELGYRIAESSADLRHISEWIFKHHERWDGTGYPFGIKSYDIPVQCRILAIVDAYFAMISDRPYRKAFSKEYAIEELRKEAGKQFDPALTEAFLELLKSEE